MKILLSLFILLTFSTAAWAQEWTNTPPDSAQTQLELNDWAAREFKTADAELNRVWNELKPKLGKSEKDALVNAQLLWIKFRDANARAAAAAYEGGSIAPFVYSQSQAETTRMRTYQLKQRLDELIRLGN